MSSQNAWSRPGNESAKMSPSKNERLTLFQPGVRGTSTITAVRTMTVLVVAMTIERRRRACS